MEICYLITTDRLRLFSVAHTHTNRYPTDPAISNLAYLSKEHVIWLIFGRHKKNEKPIKELQSLQRCDTHVQEYSKQNRHGDVTQKWSKHYR